jgi:peroxiredoxin
LVVKEWIKGGPVAVESGTNSTVLVIWNSTIPACRDSLLYLSGLQQRFKTNGVVIVGVSDEPVETLKEFVLRDGGTNIQYLIAADDQRKTAISYMKPVKQRGVPYAFVIGTNGLLLWHGHPQRGLAEVLERVSAGRLDAEEVKKTQIAAHQMEQYLGLVRRGDSRARPAGIHVLAMRTNDVPLLCDLAYQIVTAPKLPKRDLDLAAAALDQAEQVAPTNTVRVMTTRAVWLFASGRQEEGMARARQALAVAQKPQDKMNTQACIRNMEAVLAAAKTNSASTNHLSQTNSSPIPPASPQVPATSTNQPRTSPGNL